MLEQASQSLSSTTWVQEERCRSLLVHLRKKWKELLLAIYVDDGLLAAVVQQEMDSLIGELNIISMKSDYFLGLKIEYREKFIKNHQNTYAKKKFGTI